MKYSIYDRKFRGYLIQALVFGAVLLALGNIAFNTIQNLENRGIASGFSFLEEEAGFDITMHLIDYDETSTYGRALLVALINTLTVSALGIVIATGLGVFLGIARLSSNWLLSRIATAYVETLRNVPLLLQIFFWYFAVFQSLPHPRNSFQLFDFIFLNVRGLFVPSLGLTSGILIWILGVVGTCLLVLWYKKTTVREKKSEEVRSPGWFFGGMAFFILFAVDATLSSNANKK